MVSVSLTTQQNRLIWLIILSSIIQKLLNNELSQLHPYEPYQQVTSSKCFSLPLIFSFDQSILSGFVEPLLSTPFSSIGHGVMCIHHCPSHGAVLAYQGRHTLALYCSCQDAYGTNTVSCCFDIWGNQNLISLHYIEKKVPRLRYLYFRSTLLSLQVVVSPEPFICVWDIICVQNMFSCCIILKGEENCWYSKWLRQIRIVGNQIITSLDTSKEDENKYISLQREDPEEEIFGRWPNQVEAKNAQFHVPYHA